MEEERSFRRERERERERERVRVVNLVAGY